MTASPNPDTLLIAGKPYASRSLTGTGKFKDLDGPAAPPRPPGADRHRRHPPHQHRPGPGEPNLLDVLPPDQYTILPNTAGCYTADDAVRTCRLARELLDGHNLVKLEVPSATRRRCIPTWSPRSPPPETLVGRLDVMVYTSDDPILQAPGGDRLRGGDAAGRADRFRPGHPEHGTT